jgi:hypothetical protein
LAFARYVGGVLSVLVVVLPVGAASHAWVSRLRPDWSGGVARLAEIVVGLAGTLIVLELVGSISLFRVEVVVPVLAVVGIVGWWAAARWPEGEAARVAPDEVPGFAPVASHSMNVVAVLAVALVAADWATRTFDAYHHGMTTADTLWYHLPLAARFVQDGSIIPLHFVDVGLVTAFYPANSELFHGMGILLMGNDVLSPVLNLCWLALALLAGWCVGRPFGVGAVTLSGVAALMAVPSLVATQPGGGYDDIVGLALLLACAAILINNHAAGGRSRMVGVVIASLAAGLAMGTKWTFIVPVGALTLGVFVLAGRGRRLRDMSFWLAGVALTGSFWYVRNWVAVGNPVPSAHVKAGPFSLPNPEITTPSTTVAHFITRWFDWREYFLPGLRLAFGPVWWALLGLAVVGLIVGMVWGSNGTTRMLAGVGLVTGVGFLITPQVLATYGAPNFFVDNVRYADPAIVLGLVLLPSIPALIGARRSWAVLAAFVAIIVATQFDGTIWPLNVFAIGFAAPIGGWDSLLGLLVGLVVLAAGTLIVGRRSLRSWRPARWIAIVAVAGLIGGGFGLQDFYLQHRYADSNRPELAWGQSISGSRIGVAGFSLELQYALYGGHLSNYVQYIGVPGPHGSYAPAAKCTQWRQQVNDGHYRYVIVTTGFVSSRNMVFTTPFSYTVWTGDDRVSKLVHRKILPGTIGSAKEYIGFSIFRLNGNLDVSACSSPTLQHVKGSPT